MKWEYFPESTVKAPPSMSKSKAAQEIELAAGAAVRSLAGAIGLHAADDVDQLLVNNLDSHIYLREWRFIILSACYDVFARRLIEILERQL